MINATACAGPGFASFFQLVAAFFTALMLAYLVVRGVESRSEDVVVQEMPGDELYVETPGPYY